jgi:outer membrane protein assembly factor BamB
LNSKNIIIDIHEYTKVIIDNFVVTETERIAFFEKNQQILLPATKFDLHVLIADVSNVICAFDISAGSVPSQNPYNNPKWTVPINDTNLSNIAIGADNLIYCTSTYALNVIDSSNGVLVWQYPIRNPNSGGTSINSTPIVDASNNVIFGARDNYIYSVNGASRTFNWRYPVLGGIQAMPIIGNKGNIFVPTDQRYIYKISESGVPVPVYNAISPMYMLNPRHTGNVKDTSSSIHYYGPTTAYKPTQIVSNDFVSGNLFVSPSIAIDSSQNLYIGSNDGYLYAYDSSCNQLGRIQLTSNPDPLYTTPLISPKGILYIGSNYGSFFAFNTITKNFIVEGNEGFPFQSSPIIDAGGSIYIAAGIHVYAIGDAGYGLYDKWLIPPYFDTSGNITSSPALGQNGYLYFGSDDGYIYAIDSLNGTLQWKYDASANATDGLPDGSPVHPIYTSAAIDASNNVIIGTGSYMNGVLYSFKKDGINGVGVVNWSNNSTDWPDPPNPLLTEQDLSDNQIGPFYNTVAIHGDTIYLSTIAYVYAINRVTGDKIWKYFNTNYYYSSPIIDASGTLFFTSIDASVDSDTNKGNGVLHSITDNYDGTYTDNWTITVATPGRLAPPVLGNNGRIYLTGTSNKVYAVY